MKVCDFCLDEQGVMEVTIHPDIEVWPVKVELPVPEMGTQDVVLELCEDHRMKIWRCVERGT